MTWFRTDDDFPEHVKMDALETAAGGWETYAASRTVWHDLGCDCARRRTDGAFTRARAHRVVRLPAPVVDRALTALVASGFLDAPEADAFQFHDWHDYQPTKAELTAERKAKTARQNKWRQSVRAARLAAEGVDGAVDAPVDASTAPSTGASTAPSHDASTGASRDASPETRGTGTSVDAAPSRPVPSRDSKETSEGDARGATPATPDPASPPGMPPSGVHPPAEAPKAKRRKPEPVEDTPPLPGTLAAKVYAAILGDPALRPIVGNPGDAASRWSDPAMFPGVDVLAGVKAAGEFAATKPGRYSDGRAFLRGWLRRMADEVAAKPKPAASGASGARSAAPAWKPATVDLGWNPPAKGAP